MGRVVGVVVCVGVGRRRVALVVIMRLAVMLVEGIVGHAPQSTVAFSVAELHCGPSIGQAHLRDGDFRSRATMQAAGGMFGRGIIDELACDVSGRKRRAAGFNVAGGGRRRWSSRGLLIRGSVGAAPHRPGECTNRTDA